MALKALMLRRSIDKKTAELAEMEKRDAEFTAREAELENAINEAKTDEEEAAVAEEVEKFEADKNAHEEGKTALRGEIEKLEADLEEEEKTEPKVEPPAADPANKERGNAKMETIEIRSLPMSRAAFDALPMERRDAIVANEGVKKFLHEVREKRSVSGAEMTVPDVFLPIIAENMYRYSKLLKHIHTVNVKGTARQTIVGTAPEAVWTEMCGALNDLNFNFNQVSVDGYKVAGCIPICNSILEDSDANLASLIIEMISSSIGRAIDKAILYGKGAGSKMPLGIVTRLAQAEKPEGYPADAPAWVDLHTSNVLQIDSSKPTAEFWAALTMAAGATTTNYSRGDQFWVMNSKTYNTLRSKLIAFNANGSVVAQFPGTLPIVGGNVEVLEFVPDGDIIGGYGDLYLFALRSGLTIKSSEHVQFIQDNTVFSGRQRADGVPVIPGAFVVININNTSPATVADFAADKANNAKLQGLTVGELVLAPSFEAGVYRYTTSASGESDAVSAVAAETDADVTIKYDGKNVNNEGTVKWARGTKDLTVTVKQGNAVRTYTVAVTKG